MSLVFDLDAGPEAGPTRVEIEPEVAIIAGFTGRDRAELEAHLDELRALGVPTPDTVPAFYQAPGSAVVQADTVATTRPDTSGEAEVVLIVVGDERYVTLGSDHTDRAAEAIDIDLAKLVCPKPIATTAWPLAIVADRLDDLQVRSWVSEGGDGGAESVYQVGRFGDLLDLRHLRELIPFDRRPDCYTLFTGTYAAQGGIRPAERFRASLADPGTGRTIELAYTVEVADVLDPTRP